MWITPDRAGAVDPDDAGDAGIPSCSRAGSVRSGPPGPGRPGSRATRPGRPHELRSGGLDRAVRVGRTARTRPARRLPAVAAARAGGPNGRIFTGSDVIIVATRRMTCLRPPIGGAASRSPPAPYDVPALRATGASVRFENSATRPPCSTPFSMSHLSATPADELESQSTGGRSRMRAALVRAGAALEFRGDVIDRRFDRTGHSPSATTCCACESIAPPTAPRPTGARVEGPPSQRGTPSPRRSGSPGRIRPTRVDHPRASWVSRCRCASTAGWKCPARPGDAAPRVVSGDGRVARGGGRAIRDRARDRRHGSARDRFFPSRCPTSWRSTKPARAGRLVAR